ncbi:hypothetical protein [Streptomyces sp. NPDC057695]|uniref:hypothetical protein n=1 Tax=Streptomyces sp. NPDC057695 TaxID=3346217 RepID=UPI0036D0D4FA
MQAGSAAVGGFYRAQDSEDLADHREEIAAARQRYAQLARVAGERRVIDPAEVEW